MSASGKDGWAASLGGRGRHLIGGGLVTLAVVLGSALFSAWPAWQSLPGDSAVLRVSFSISGERNCRERSEAEIAALPRNMRTAQECERRRRPVAFTVTIDGAEVISKVVEPSGLSGSGPSRIYERIVLPAGTHAVGVSLRNDPALEAVTHAGAFDLTLAAGESAAVDFDSGTGTFILR
ncbi:MAG: hypothetical protein IT542_05540 [Rubellimicrobium sp.]|nr:hypothetical protein [Rubellimicrobium sp.]